MKSFQCLVILSVWTYLISVGVGIRVPSAWDQAQQQSVRNYDGGINLNNRFFINNQPQEYNDGRLERTVFLENEQGSAELGNLYKTLQSSALNDFLGHPHPMLVLSHNGLYMFPQVNQQSAAIPSETNQYSNELPPLQHQRYQQSPQLQNNNNMQFVRSTDHAAVTTSDNQNQKVYKSPSGTIQNAAFHNYQTFPSNVLRISSSGNGNWNQHYMEQAKLRQPILKQFTPKKYKPALHKQYAQTLSTSHDTQVELPAQSLYNHVPQDHTFIVSASTLSPIESDPNQANPSVEFTTKKEPIIFVTEGYRNVLIQGPNKKKKYQRPQYQNREESRKVLQTKKLGQKNVSEDDDDDDDDKLPRKRKVTKIYKIHGNGPSQDNSAGGSSRNLVESSWKRPRQQFRRPPVLTEYDRRSGLKQQLINNYRDDKTHEPSDNHDQEKEDDEKERIQDDENDNTEEALEKEDDTEDDDDLNNEDSPKLENDHTDKDKLDENEESDDEDSESDDEEEPQQEVPHSDHADPPPVPTKPIYPGEGAWAKQGVKHTPYVSQHRFIKPQEVEQKPDGYNVFEDLEKFFESQRDQFGRSFGEKIVPSPRPISSTQTLNRLPLIKPPSASGPTVVYDPFQESSETASQQVPLFTNGRHQNIKQEQVAEEQLESNDENDTENEEQPHGEGGFVPMQLYSQVRKSENEEHEPHDPLEHGRLREVIKDSKIQTVYSEEGYEDAAYDHAGHEKKAEQDQGHEEFEREKSKKTKPEEKDESDSDARQSKEILVSDELLEDSVPADSIYPSLPTESTIANQDISKLSMKKPKPLNNKNFITTQELKTTQVKDKKNGDVQLEIQSEVKVIMQPNNSTKAHKYIKIYPKVLREFSKEIPETREEDETNNSNYEENKEEVKPSITTTVKVENIDEETVTNREELTESIDKPVEARVSDIDLNIETHKEAKIKIADAVDSDTGSTISTSAPKVSFKAFKDEFSKKTTEEPQVIVKVLDDKGALTKISEQFGLIGSQVHRKRRSINSDDKDLDIDIGFIDKINHTFAPKKPDVIDVEKYPYYKRQDINENSPLRYAENTANIPVKREGELSFYKMADKFLCPDLPQNIDPIPEHVQNAHKNTEQSDNDEEDDEDEDTEDDEEGGEESDEDDTEDEDEESSVDQKHPPTPKAPRIQLGDKIDCLKVRYFGENPFDNPFFKEETVGPIKSIFKELDRTSAKIQNNENIDNSRTTSQIIENINKVNEIFNHKEKKDERIFESEVKDKVFNALKETAHKFNNPPRKVDTIEDENDDAESIKTTVKVIKPTDSEKSGSQHIEPITPAPLVTLITTPKYTIQLRPKNIYDQIRLLDHLPEEEEEEEAVTEVTETLTKDTEPTTMAKPETEAPVEVTTKAVNIAIQRKIDQLDRKKESSRREPKVLKEERIGEEEQHEEQRTNTPEAESFRRRRLRPRRPVYQIFDVNQFLTTTPYSIITNVHSTVLPKNKVISEVFYKDEIKPNEQLNVFADILNNIKNSTNVEPLPIQSSSNFAESDAFTISNLEETNIVPQVQSTPKIRVKKYQKDRSNSKNVIDRYPVQNLHTTEKQYNARYPESYEEHHGTHHSTTNKNIVALNFDDPDTFGYVDGNTRSTPKNYLSEEDNNQYRNPSNTKVTTKKFIRRRRKPTKGTTASTTSTPLRTTTKINDPTQSAPSNHKPYVRDVLKDVGVVGLVPPRQWLYKTIFDDSVAKGTSENPAQVYEYKTIPPNFIEQPLTGPAAVTELIDEDTPSRPMNKYYFVGLKPPMNQRARPYSEFLGNKKVMNTNGKNNIRRRMANVGYVHFRYKREAARATYAEVTRNRGRQNEGLQKETAPLDDVDDYVPHRPKNYYYDEKTGKIVYHNKPKEDSIEEDEEEVEYEEIPETPGLYLEKAEDATHPPPKRATTKPLLATATPPPEGKGLLDFVANLKNNPSYKFIPDPTTPDPASESSAHETVTVDSKSTNPPPFLSILSKVKSDTSYKFIEDPKESQLKSKSKTTTPEPEYEEEEEDDEEEEQGSAPKRRFARQTDLLIFNIGDYLPKIQTPISSPIPKTPTNFLKKQIVERFFPKLRYMTPLDIAKEKIHERFQNNSVYQFIQKNIQNSPGGQTHELSNIQIFDIGEYLPKIKTVSPKTSIDYSKYKTIERPRHNMSSRYNSDDEPNLEEVVHVRRPIVMEERESIDRPVVSEERVVHDKEAPVAAKEKISSTTQKIVQFRRGTRPTTQRTTAEIVEATESLATRRNSNRRRPVPSGFRTTRRPTTVDATETTEKVERVYPQYSQTEKTYSQTHEPSKRVYRRRPVRIRHTTERHEEDEETIDQIVRRSLNDDVDDSRNEFEKGSLEEQNISETHGNVKEIIVDNIDDKEEKESVINKAIQEAGGRVNSKIEVKRSVKNGNTKEIDDLNDGTEEEESSGKNQGKHELKESTLELAKEKSETENDKADIEPKENFEADGDLPSKSKKKDVEIINPDYNETKKHGGNYRKENESTDEVKEIIEELNTKGSTLTDETSIKSDDVEIVNENFDKTKRHGGNYKAVQKIEVDKISADIQQAKSTKNLRFKKFRPKSDKYKNNNNSVNAKEAVENSKNKYNSFLNKRLRTRFRPNGTISRLTDVVPKPDHFYTDSKLPKEVNTLKIGTSEVKLDSRELEQVTEEGDDTDIEDVPNRRIINNRRSHNTNRNNDDKIAATGDESNATKIDKSDDRKDEENLPNRRIVGNKRIYNTNENSDDEIDATNDESSETKNKELVDSYDEFEEEIHPTEKPLFIKDPSKRLYFYAPV